MDEIPPGIRRVCMAVDVERYSEHSGTELAAARWQLSALLADMCDSPGFGDLLLYQQSADDGEVVVLPVGIDEPRTVTFLLNWLVRALRRPDSSWEGPQVRLRVAVHEGITMLTGGVFDGPAVRQARRLLGALPLSRALRSRPTANLAVLFSDRIYADLGEFGQCLRSEEVIPVEVGDPAARSREVGWLLVPEREVPDGEGDPPGRSE
jgi:hypothetical protein